VSPKEVEIARLSDETKVRQYRAPSFRNSTVPRHFEQAGDWENITQSGKATLLKRIIANALTEGITTRKSACDLDT
jgi:hypothetical protein